ncbi:carbohydrate ABC transporter permease [Halogranum rubrum]|uniref:carbohydrate ABC transporter permease n=1 Tax=Halogranum rubrum TaxID=553466 RepID=UPI0012FADC2A|nr:sugar ABC transporter permease [Halogranum salarium]
MWVLEDRSVKWLFVLPAFLYAVAWVLYPMVFLFRLSVFSDVGGTFVGLQNFVSVLDSVTFTNAVKNTLVFAVPAVTLKIVLGLGVAVAFDELTRDRDLVQTLLLMPMVLTPFAVGLMFRWFFDSELGIINYLLGAAGVSGPVWLSTPGVAMASVIIADVWQWTPFAFVMLYAALQSVPRDLIEAAMMDGANWFQRFRYIILPQLYSVLTITTLILLIMSFKGGDKIFAMTGGGPGSTTKTLTMLIYENAFSFLNSAKAAAMSVLFLVVIIVIGNLFVLVLSRIRGET